MFDTRALVVGLVLHNLFNSQFMITPLPLKKHTRASCKDLGSFQLPRFYQMAESMEV